jgi:uncharacterized protein YbjT (DUF2867 family)
MQRFPEASRVLVTGGTGRLGRPVVARLRDGGVPVRVLSRRAPAGVDGAEWCTGDLMNGAGVGPALAGVRVIVHCASSNKGDAEMTRHLVRAAAAAAEPPHLVYVSIVGADRVAFGYTRTKLACERIVTSSGLPWTTLRATQFYDMILTGTQALARLPVAPVPAGFLIQPVDAADVAVRLAELALGPPVGQAPDLGGPQVLSFADLVREYLRARGSRRAVLPVWLPGLRAVRSGALLVGGQVPAEPVRGGLAPGSTAGQRTWAEFLAGRLTPMAAKAPPRSVGGRA